jgi:hypothetical protein
MIYLFSLLSPAHDIAAYLDPGSGSFLIQLLIGGVVGLLLVIRTFWGRIKLFINNLLGRETAVDPEMEQTEGHEDTP